MRDASLVSSCLCTVTIVAFVHIHNGQLCECKPICSFRRWCKDQQFSKIKDEFKYSSLITLQAARFGDSTASGNLLVASDHSYIDDFLEKYVSPLMDGWSNMSAAELKLQRFQIPA